MKLCDYSIFPSSWETDTSDGIDAATSKWSSSPSLLSGCELAASTPIVTTTACNNSSMTIEQPSFSSLSTAPSMAPSLMAPPVTQDPNFVNVYMVVDPTKQTVTFPQQIVTYKTGDVVSTAVVGPFIIGDQQLQALFQVAQAMTNASNSNASNSSSSSLPDTAPPSAIVPPVTFSADPRTTLESLSNLNKNAAAAAAATLPPLKPLSAYNFFFRDERDRILNECGHDWSMSKQQKLLEDHWGRDRHVKRRHRKTHGKIDFTSLSRLISTRWKKLAEHHKDFYRQVASMDFERYQRDLTNQQQQQFMIPSNNSSSSFIMDYVPVVA